MTVSLLFIQKTCTCTVNVTCIIFLLPLATQFLLFIFLETRQFFFLHVHYSCYRIQKTSKYNTKHMVNCLIPKSQTWRNTLLYFICICSMFIFSCLNFQNVSVQYLVQCTFGPYMDMGVARSPMGMEVPKPHKKVALWVGVFGQVVSQNKRAFTKKY